MEICEMGGVRENCRVMEKAKYWTELEPTIHKFFKFMVPGFRTQLRIPKKFTSNFREELPETLSLRGPSGSTWRVCVRKRNEEMLLCCGWNRFVEEHQLQESDVLVFQYAGDSTFRVEIFEIGGCCEREGAYFVNQHSRACSDDFCILQKKVREEAEEIRQLEWTDGEDESDKIVRKEKT